MGSSGALFTQWQPPTLASRSVTVVKTMPVHPSEAESRCFLDSKMEFWPEGSLCFLAPSAEMHGHLTHAQLCRRRTVRCRSHTHLCQTFGNQGYFSGLVHAASHLSVESTVWRHWVCSYGDVKKKKRGLNKIRLVCIYNIFMAFSRKLQPNDHLRSSARASQGVSDCVRPQFGFIQTVIQNPILIQIETE